MIAVRTLSIAALFAAPLAASSAYAATSWSSPSGSQTNFTYSAGQSANGNFGSPIVGGGQFLFSPSDLSASSTGSPDSNSDTASVVLNANTGRDLKTIKASLGGDYTVLDGTPVPSYRQASPSLLAAPNVSAIGTLKLTNLSTSAVLTQSFNFGGLTNEDGIFTDNVQITLPAGWRSAKIDLYASVSASADEGSAAFVQFKTASFGVDTAASAAAVPLPPAVLAALPTIAMAYYARKRMRRA